MFGRYEVVNHIETNIYRPDCEDFGDIVRDDECVVKAGTLEECINYLKIQMFDFMLKMENQDICTSVDNSIYNKHYPSLRLICRDFDYEVYHYSSYVIYKIYW